MTLINLFFQALETWGPPTPTDEKTENDDPPAFTPAPRNRPLQFLFCLFFVLPQVGVYMTSENMDAYKELASLCDHVLHLNNWQIWVQEPLFLLIILCLAFERMCYTIVWLFPSHFCHWAENGPLRNLGEPLDVIVFLFYVSKVFQFGSMGGFYAITADPVNLSQLSLLRIVTGSQLLIVGQILNISIYNAIGKAGVYYGYKIGVPVPWVTGFPFNVFTMHPQYAGAVMTIFGAGVLLVTEEHARRGLVAVAIIGALYYFYMSIIEDMPVEHPLDQTTLRSPKSIEHLRPER